VSGPQSPPVIAVPGLGEAGSAIAADLVSAGAAVQGFDPKAPAPPGVTGRGSDADAARGAAIVIALTSAHEAMETLERALPGPPR
jgi:3-hydroxyisobutyrate dehydrogenase-like beta-hydroxyacid dehydrogenase